MSAIKVPDSERLPVSVLVERQLASNGRWTQYQWQCLEILCGLDSAGDAPGCTLISEDDETRTSRYMWSGMHIDLFKDGCESYWYNLLSEKPYLFVICFHDQDLDDDEDPAAMEPILVTPNQDEANAHMESEDLVFSVPMPEQVIEWVERFVVEHYDPVIKKKRKRQDWARESDKSAKERHEQRRLH